MKKLVLGLALAAALTAPAYAGPSNSSFSYTGSGNNATLTINGSTTLTALDRGWITSTGVNNGGGPTGNYIAGVCGSSDGCFGDDLDRHDYFVFDISQLSGPTTSAVLHLDQPSNGYISTASWLKFTLWDSTVAGPAMSSTNSVPFYNDLGSGISFGSVLVNSATNGTTVDITLNAAGIAALNDSVRRFGFGGAIAGVPEPGSWAMMIGGFALAGFAIRRRKTNVSFA